MSATLAMQVTLTREFHFTSAASLSNNTFCEKSRGEPRGGVWGSLASGGSSKEQSKNEHLTDSTIAHSRNRDFLSRTFHGCSTRNMIAMKSKPPCMSLTAKDYRTMTSRWQGPPYFIGYGRELLSKISFSLKKRWGGYR